MVKIWQPMAHVVAQDPTTITLAVILSYKIQQNRSKQFSACIYAKAKFYFKKLQNNCKPVVLTGYTKVL